MSIFNLRFASVMKFKVAKGQWADSLRIEATNRWNWVRSYNDVTRVEAPSRDGTGNILIYYSTLFIIFQIC